MAQGISHRSHVSYIDKSREYYRASGYDRPYRWAHYEDAPFSRLAKPLSQSRIGVVTTADRAPGVFLAGLLVGVAGFAPPPCVPAEAPFLLMTAGFCPQAVPATIARTTIPVAGPSIARRRSEIDEME